MITAAKSLKSLKLADVSINEESTVTIAQAIEKNQSLREINLKFRALSSSVMRNITGMVSCHPTVLKGRLQFNSEESLDEQEKKMLLNSLTKMLENKKFKVTLS